MERVAEIVGRQPVELRAPVDDVRAEIEAMVEVALRFLPDEEAGLRERASDVLAGLPAGPWLSFSEIKASFGEFVGPVADRVQERLGRSAVEEFLTAIEGSPAAGEV
jgi:hypothetical protein